MAQVVVAPKEIGTEGNAGDLSENRLEWPEIGLGLINGAQKPRGIEWA
ncbi:MAG: hypothetical protein JNL87_09220 [Burkholderiaceae bacterium]|nr:hypothetical protein [Burkholderiaceae bacterium]